MTLIEDIVDDVTGAELHSALPICEGSSPGGPSSKGDFHLLRALFDG